MTSRLFACALLLWGCDSETTNLVDSDGSVVAPRDSASASDTTPTPFETNTQGEVLCGDVPCSCDNGQDDDGDGLIDGLDPECTGPYDNDEGTFATGIPGDNMDPKCQDCFFDGNSGSGDDGCRYATSCLTEGTPESGSGACNTCEATTECVDFCRPRTPNGCDCYGCCEVVLPDGTVGAVLLTDSCSVDSVSDASACTPCMPSTDCRNECGRCELCPGKTEADLPDDCAQPAPDGGPEPPAYRCDDGEQVCSDSSPCPSNFYCQLGCCLPIII